MNKRFYRRSSFEVRMDILRAMVDGYRVKNRIANASRVSGSITPILNAFHNRKMITVSMEGRRDVYFITDKGRATLKSYHENRVAVGLTY